jgi:hypothetical protein
MVGADGRSSAVQRNFITSISQEIDVMFQKPFASAKSIA